MKAARHFDVVVVGAGVAGITAGARLAEEGASVCVLARGVGSTHLAPGTVDVLGRDPELVKRPRESLFKFASANPTHPYAVMGPEAIEPALDWFAARIEHGPQPGYRYEGGLDRNRLLPTALGALRPSALVPETMAAGELPPGCAVCVVGVPVLRDFHGSLCAANLARAGFDARAVALELHVGRPEANSLELARRLDEPSFRSGFAARLAPQLRGDERVAVPAILGLRDPHGAWSELERRLERRVFEIPTLPPSGSGTRVYDALRAALRAAGGRLVLGAEVVEGERDGARVTGLRARTSGHDTIYGARWVVLATGGVHSGGIELSADWRGREAVLGLPLRGLPATGGPRSVADYFGEQPIARMGVAIDRSLLAEGTENVFVAGAALPGAEPWRENSGEGIALTSGHFAAQAVLEREGARTAVGDTKARA